MTHYNNRRNAERLHGKVIPIPTAGDDEKAIVWDNDTSAFKYDTAGDTYTGGDGIDVTGTTISTDLAALPGLEIDTAKLKAKVDDSTIEIDGIGGALQVKDSGITTTKLASVTGSDTTVVTGTTGTDGYFAAWNSDGDLVDGKAAPTGDVVGTTDEQTLTNKTIDGDDNTVQDLPYSAIKSTSRSGSDETLVTGTKGSDTYIGQWNADGDLIGVQLVPIANGGTGISTAPSDGKLLIGKTDGSYASATLTQGSNVTITNGDGTITIASTGGSGDARWTALTITTDFDDDPPSSSTITMNSDQTGNIPVGSPIKFTLGGGASNPGTYYAVVTALTDSLMTIAGAPLETDDGDLTALSYGTPEMVEQVDIAINGYYESANDTAAILNQLNMSLLWNKPKAYAVRYRVWSKVEDTSDDGKATVLINSTELNTSAGGLTIAAAATWYSTVVDIATAAYDINPGEAIEISVTKGTTGDAHDLAVSIIFVYP